MGFLGFILVFMFFWIILLILIAIFSILCIIFSAASASKAKQFLAAHQYLDYKKAKGMFIAALVFFILTCLNSVVVLLPLEYLVDSLTSGYYGVEELFDPVTLLFFVLPPALLITALVLGIRCFVWYGRAKKHHMQLSMASATVQYFSNAQPRYFSTEQGFRVCPICGTSNDPGHNFCVKCGRALS